MSSQKRTVILFALAMPMVLPPSARAEMATIEEALMVADNWVTLILDAEGSWGGSHTAWVEGIQEFERDGRIIGYFCRVRPQGFIVTSLHKELGPVKAYSAVCGLDPEAEEGMADLIKGKMEQILDGLEQVAFERSIQSDQRAAFLEVDYRSAWEQLGSRSSTLKTRPELGITSMDYRGGDPPLLTSHWIQGRPYNLDCPSPPSDSDCTSTHCDVGCVPLAGAQVMRYWAWPPERPTGGVYDWAHMANRYIYDHGARTWQDENGNPLTPAHLDAVATLCHDIGVQCGAEYCEGGKGPCATEASFSSLVGGKDLLDTFEDHYWYSDAADDYDRDDYSAEEWFDLIKNELNANRPIPYTVEKHVIVCDGWKEESGTPVKRYYHMNYGWGRTDTCQNGCNAWYLLDELYRGGEHEERMLLDIYPAPAVGHTVSGLYLAGGYSSHRYFDRDAQGNLAVFGEGQNLQFLPGVRVRCTGDEDGTIEFLGTSAWPTRLFSIKGTSTGGAVAGIHIYDGGLRLYRNGCLRLH